MTPPRQLKSSYDVIVIGAGHNGLVHAGYLAKAGYKVAVFEKRHIEGGCADRKSTRLNSSHT